MKRTILLSVSAIIMTLLLSVSFGAGAAENETAPVSPALQIIANHTPIAKAGLVGNELLFSAEDFERALNIDKISSITITKAPAVTDGELLVGSVRLAEGNTISRTHISMMSYAAATDDIKDTSFSFTVNGSPYSVTCSLYLLDKVNHSPSANEGVKTVGTFRDIAVFGRLGGTDPEGDKLTYQVIAYPKNGAFILTDDDGSYVYMPNEGYIGSDELRYVVYDTYGNYSTASTLELSVGKNGISYVYDDLDLHEAHSAAIKVSGAGIMSGTRIGTGYYFYPDATVSRSEFLVMAMRAAGITNLPEVANTGFADDDKIPSDMKKYIGAAARAGYVSGVRVGGKLCFEPEREITLAEASVVVANIMRLEFDGTIPTAAQGSNVPAWAAESLYALCDSNIIENCHAHSAPLTRSDTAMMLARIMDIE